MLHLGEKQKLQCIRSVFKNKVQCMYYEVKNNNIINAYVPYFSTDKIQLCIFSLILNHLGNNTNNNR